MKRLKNESVYKQIYKLFSLIGGIYENQSLRFDFITLILLILSRCCEPFSIQAQEITTIIKCTIICCNIFYFFVINSGSLYNLFLTEYHAWLNLCVWWDTWMQCMILQYPYSFDSNLAKTKMIWYPTNQKDSHLFSYSHKSCLNLERILNAVCK